MPIFLETNSFSPRKTCGCFDCGIKELEQQERGFSISEWLKFADSPNNGSLEPIKVTHVNGKELLVEIPDSDSFSEDEQELFDSVGQRYSPEEAAQWLYSEDVKPQGPKEKTFSYGMNYVGYGDFDRVDEEDFGVSKIRTYYSHRNGGMSDFVFE